MKVGRNERCPCGSGRKYKNCCEAKQKVRAASRANWTLVLLAVLVLLGAAGLVVAFMGDKNAAPPGRVWSSEHNHWHDAGTGTATPSGPVSQPPGPVPPGKVWSPEHGHWHDLQ